LTIDDKPFTTRLLWAIASALFCIAAMIAIGCLLGVSP
jgi:hypothetical protein